MTDVMLTHPFLSLMSSLGPFTYFHPIPMQMTHACVVILAPLEALCRCLSFAKPTLSPHPSTLALKTHEPITPNMPMAAIHTHFIPILQLSNTHHHACYHTPTQVHHFFPYPYTPLIPFHHIPLYPLPYSTTPIYSLTLPHFPFHTCKPIFTHHPA